MKVHILYLTNKCNLRCPYCYEGQGKTSRKNKVITQKEIYSFLDKIVQDEPTGSSTLCLMGGEPFLEFKKIKQVFEYCTKLRHEKNKFICINIISNGTLLHKYIDDLQFMLCSDDNAYMSLDISYDGMNQHVRTPKSDIVQRNLKLLKDRNIPFGLSYTITENNYKPKVFLTEIITLLEEYYPDIEQNIKNNSRKKIRVNLALTNIEKAMQVDSLNHDKYYSQFNKEFDYIFSKYRIPICDISCSVCQRCDKSSFTGRQYCIPGKDSLIEEPMVTANSFNHF